MCILALATVLLAPAARADSLKEDVAQVDGMIRASGAGAVFTNETTAAGDLVARHAPSGMSCHFLSPGRLIYDPATSGVACVSQRSTYVSSLAAAPAAGATPDAVLAATVESLAKGQALQERRLSEIDTKLLVDPKLPPSVSRRFDVGADSWFVAVAETKGWFIVMEAKSRLRDDDMGQLEQDLEWRKVLEGLKPS